MPGIMSISDGLRLDEAREVWLQDWLARFGSWVYSGRLIKRQSSMIAEFMATVERRVFNFNPDERLRVLLENFDLMPRPSGVGVKYSIVAKKAFGHGEHRKNFLESNFGE